MKLKLICSILKARLAAPCHECQKYPPDKVHIVSGKYYCPLHCPVHGSDLEREAIVDKEVP